MVVWLVMFQCALFAGAVGILEAAKAGDAAGVRSILQTNAAAASLTNSLGETALHLGAWAPSPAVVEALLAAKAPVNAHAQGGDGAALCHRLRADAPRLQGPGQDQHAANT